MILILTSIDDENKADMMAESLITQQLAACVHISAKGRSVYHWQGKLCKETEYTMHIKTIKKHQQAVLTWLEKHHPYHTPEIIILQATASQKYTDWLNSSFI